MPDEIREKESNSYPPEGSSQGQTEVHENGTETSSQKQKEEQKINILKTELETINEKRETNKITPALSAISESGAEYDSSYAAIADSRFGKGSLAKHGEAIMAEAIKSGIPDNAVILEIGCNTGMLLEQLKARLGEKSSKILGVDFNKDAIETAKQKGLDASFGDAQNLEDIPDNSINIIFSLHTYEHIPNLGKAFRELQRILKPGGKAYIIVPPNMYGLETIRVAAEDIPEDKKGEGVFGGIKTFFNAWSYARKLHCSNLGGPFGGARNHAEKIMKSAGITDLKVSGGMRPALSLANFLIFEKSTPPIS